MHTTRWKLTSRAACHQEIHTVYTRYDVVSEWWCFVFTFFIFFYFFSFYTYHHNIFFALHSSFIDSDSPYMFLYLSQGPIFVAFFQSYLYFSDLIRLRACTRAHWTFIISVVHIGCFLFRTICHSRCFVWKFSVGVHCTATHTTQCPPLVLRVFSSHSQNVQSTLIGCK